MRNRVSGDKLRALLKRYGLEGNEAADKAAKLLYVGRATAQAWYSRGVDVRYYELLERKLKDEKGG